MFAVDDETFHAFKIAKKPNKFSEENQHLNAAILCRTQDANEAEQAAKEILD